MADPPPADQPPPRPVPLIPLPIREGPGAALPAPPTPFVGREREVAAVAALLRGDGLRLVTLTGPGGVGKTRLALAVAAEVAPDLADGVAFVDLSPLADPGLVLPEIARALGLRQAGDRLVAAQLAGWLAARELLLVLDNLEQVAEAAPQLAALLAACPALTVLATSRVVLRLSAEQVVPVEPLALPGPARSQPPEDLAAVEAVALFAQRARAADPAFALTAATAPAVAEIVRRLDGLPLAIELAAARVRLLSPAALLARLSGRLRLLTGGARDLPARQRTMRDAIAWSHDLLPPAEQALFRRLGIFVGGFTIEAAEAVVGASAGVDAFEGVASLLDKSLLRKADGAGEPRYAMLETVREFAVDQLQASGDLEQVGHAHAAWCLAFAEAFAPWLRGEEPIASLDRLEPELDNLRAAFGWAIERGEAEIAQRLAADLAEFWPARGHLGEGRRWGERALALPGDVPQVVRARALITQSFLTTEHGDPEAARPLAEEGLAIARALGDAVQEARAVTALGVISAEEGDLDRAQAWFEQALALVRALGNRRWVQALLTNIGVMVQFRGDPARAGGLYEEALANARAFGERETVSHAGGNLAVALKEQGQTRRAAALLREVLGLAQPGHLAIMLSDAAEFGADAGRPREAARLLGAAAALRAALDVPVPRLNRAEVERLVASLRAALGEESYEAARAAGAALPLDAAVAEADALLAALAEAPEPSKPASPAAPGGLSPRELEVVRLIAAGRSNREIADALYVSHGTATTHVRNILGKLGLDSRTAVAAWAIRHGLD